MSNGLKIEPVTGGSPGEPVVRLAGAVAVIDAGALVCEFALSDEVPPMPAMRLGAKLRRVLGARVPGARIWAPPCPDVPEAMAAYFSVLGALHALCWPVVMFVAVPGSCPESIASRAGAGGGPADPGEGSEVAGSSVRLRYAAGDSAVAPGELLVLCRLAWQEGVG